MCAFAPYDLENVKVTGYDVVANRPKATAYRAPGAPQSEFAVESVIDELAKAIGMDPVALRLKNAAKEGTRAAYGPTFGPVGLVETLEAARAHEHYGARLEPGQGRGVASGFWFNIGGETCANLNLGEDGTIALVAGTPDIGGSRAALCLQAAEALGVDVETIRPLIADTSSLGYTFLTGGSRTAFASGMAVIEASKDMIGQLCERAAKIWNIPVDAVEWVEGEARPAGANAGEFEPLPLAELAGLAGKTGGPIVGRAQINAQGAGPSFGTHVVDVDVDRETGRVEILRYTVIQDAGKAVHPDYVEGQMQGGAVQGIGWALNEEYVYDEHGRLENPGFLDYRIPVCSDVPMIDTVIVEVPNPTHPYGVRGVGETPIIPPMAAIANAVEGALGIRFTDLPMSPAEGAEGPRRGTPPGGRGLRIGGGAGRLHRQLPAFRRRRHRDGDRRGQRARPPRKAGRALSGARAAPRRRRRAGHRRRDPPGRPVLADRAGQRRAPDAEDRGGLIWPWTEDRPGSAGRAEGRCLPFRAPGTPLDIPGRWRRARRCYEKEIVSRSPRMLI